jgi:primary-amine oxidase
MISLIKFTTDSLGKSIYQFRPFIDSRTLSGYLLNRGKAMTDNPIHISQKMNHRNYLQRNMYSCCAISSKSASLNTSYSSFHPLEPLSAAEVAATVSLIKKLDIYSFTSTRIISIMLKEPHKAIVNSWHEKKGAFQLDRHSTAVLIDNDSNSTYECIFNITQMENIKLLKAPKGSQPIISFDEMAECEAAVLASDLFRDAFRKHYGDKIDIDKHVMVDVWSVGYYGRDSDNADISEERNIRLSRPLCFIRSDDTDNGYARPIEGLRPVVDLNKMKVMTIILYFTMPIYI